MDIMYCPPSRYESCITMAHVFEKYLKNTKPLGYALIINPDVRIKKGWKKSGPNLALHHQYKANCRVGMEPDTIEVAGILAGGYFHLLM